MSKTEIYKMTPALQTMVENAGACVCRMRAWDGVVTFYEQEIERLAGDILSLVDKGESTMSIRMRFKGEMVPVDKYYERRVGNETK